MRLNAQILIRATEKQLMALGTKRRFNSGWLRKALVTEFTKEQVDEFVILQASRPPRNYFKKKKERPALGKGRDIPYGPGSPEEYANAIYLEFRHEFDAVSLTTIPKKIWQ